ncbi:alpha/beta fold hydrolase [Streptomyces sp. G-G2]|nr:alpha/beta fold hydrolase [Streptomyces sp. G-G2]MDJ0382071.1 alpha/beta fold hydrolase [Streptomyces sp. G-G2]
MVRRWGPPDPEAVVLLLHGGRADALDPPSRLNLPRTRLRPFGSAIAAATGLDRVLVAEVRYRHRGWNGARADAARDARRALAEVRRDAGPVPVVLVGHSMGARAALAVADDPFVRGVVALAPWCPPGEPTGHLTGRRLLLLHDPADRVTAARATWDFAQRARADGAWALGVLMPKGGHAMLRDAHVWHRVTTALTLGLLGLAPLPPELWAPGSEPVLPLERLLPRLGSAPGPLPDAPARSSTGRPPPPN